MGVRDNKPSGSQVAVSGLEVSAGIDASFEARAVVCRKHWGLEPVPIDVQLD